MSKYTRKKDKPPEKDEFVSFWEKLFTAAAPYARAIGVSSAVAVAIIAAVWGGVAYSQGKTEAGTEALGKALKTYEAEVTTGDVDPTPKADVKADPAAPPKFKTDKERLDAAIAEADKVKKEHGGAPATFAELVRASALFEAGKLDEAIAIYQAQVDKVDGAVQPLVRESLGLALEQKGDLDGALKQYQLLEPKQGDFYRDRALYAAARIYGKKGDKKKAIETYRDIVVKMPTTSLKDDIQVQLGLLGESLLPPPKADALKGDAPKVDAPKVENK